VIFALFVFVLVYPILPVSLNCSILIVPSISSNIYLLFALFCTINSKFAVPK
jgi:hypothetical protein